MKNSITLQCIIVFMGFFACTNSCADDLGRVLAEVHNSHPALQAEREQLKATEQGIYQAYAGFLPSASAEYDKGRQRIKYNSLAPERESTDNKRLVVTQPIFNGGGTIAQIGSAKARLESAEARYKQLQQQILMNVATAYIVVVEMQRVLDISHDNVKALTTHLAATQKQYAAGELTVTDVSQSEARLARAQAELHDAEAALADARDAYMRETNTQATSSTFPTLPIGLPISASEISIESDAYPAVVEAKKNEDVADYTINERAAALLPTVRVEGQLGTRKGSNQPNLDYTNDRSVMLRVSVPIFQSGAEYSRVIEARHQYARSKNQTEDITRDTLKTALREWNNFTAAAAAIAEHGKAMNAAQKSLDSVSKERLVGSRTVLDVLNAQDELNAAQINLTRAQSRHVLSAYRLLAAMGKLENGTALLTHDKLEHESNQVDIPL